ncbi:hypothetical protein GCM10012275_19630 [Longimycelium tulufanense]|uniref:Uncharacterized protein n=1 Tax=Longimycelium tulufanense TaxID=907463 RepID=A0A8J3FVY8_9PSEU|nr:SDR family oxidoreductase [Longimycelium tulufanense]GGM48766.1 hypothetical protein GCM10012275_19630 [Longimycelium tulufanense]
MTGEHYPPVKAAGIIGGTRGLGFQLALRAHRADLHTVVYGRSAEKIPEKKLPGAEQRYVDLCDRDSVNRCDVHLPGPARILWVAGAFLKKPLADTSDAEIDGLTSLLLTGPLILLRRLLDAVPGPVHLVTIASSSGWRRRTDEALYCALKAAQAHCTRNLVPELLRRHPDSRVTLVNPGGLAIPEFHTGLALDYGTMMDPGEVADIIWRTATEQCEPFTEIQILRSRAPGREGTPQVSFGPRTPELPV